MSGIVRELEVDGRCSPKASTYDQFSAGLVASILIFGFVVLGLLVVWLFGDQQQSHGVVPDYDPRPIAEEEPAGLEQELDEIVGGSDATELTSLLESIENAVSPQAAADGSPDVGNSLPGPPDGRDPNPVPPVPDSYLSRWKVSFEVEGVEQYKRQLDFLEIEIGVIDRHEDDIWRIGKMSGDVSVAHSNRADEKLSTWFAHSKPMFKRWDRQIAKEAGLAAEDRLFVQFYPVDLVSKIKSLEAEALLEQGRELDQVDITNIRIAQSGDQFTVSISDFEFR